MMTRSQSPFRHRARIRVFSAVCLCCAGIGVIQSDAQAAGQDPNDFESAFKSFIAAQQDALTSGDADRILASSGPVAAASLALLNNFDKPDQESRKAEGALPYAGSLLTDLPTEMLVLRMELSLGETVAAAELRKHIESSNPDTTKLHMDLSEVLEKNRQLDDAVREAQRAAEMEPASRDAQVTLGMAYWSLNAFQYNEDTLRAFTAAHKIDPNSFSTNLLLGAIESQYHQFDAASQHLHAAITADASQPEPWYQLGLNAYEQSNLAEAQGQLEHYLSLAEAGKNGNPSQVRIALLTLDEIAEEQGEAPDEAHRAEEDALKKQLPETIGATDADANGGALAMGAPDTQGRASMAEQARVPVLEKPAMSSEMQATLGQLRQLAANSLLNVGTVLARRQDYAAAVLPFKYAAAEDPTMEPVMRNLGLAAYISGDYEQSAEALKKVVAAHADDSTAREFLGMAEFEIGEYSDAATTFASLGDTVSAKPLVAATAAAAFVRVGDRSRGEQAMAALKNAAADPQLQAREAVAYLDLGDVERASESANAALSVGQNSAEAQRVLGVIALERGDAAKAANEFESACKAEHEGSRNQLECQALLAMALSESGRKTESDELVAKVTKADPKLADALARQAETLLKNGDVQAAYEKSAAAFALAPREKEIRTGFEAAKRAAMAR